MSTPYEEALDAFFARRVAPLLAPNGWLSCVDRIWLERELNVLPFGTLCIDGEVLRLSADPGVDVSGQRVRHAELFAEGLGEPHAFSVDERTYVAARQGDRYSLRIYSADAPRRRAFRGVPRFAADPSWQVEARFEAFATPRTKAIPFSSDELIERPVVGELVFVVRGETYRMSVLREPNDKLLMVFGDRTNRDETYQAGRFLTVSAGGENGCIALDFNRALNPACAFSEIAICPLPPPENRLDVRIEAGEKRPVFEP